MAIRHLLTPVLALAAFAPVIAGNTAAKVRGKLLPDLPQHVQFAQKCLDHGEVSGALAHLSLVLVDKPMRYHINFKDVSPELQPICAAAFRDGLAMWERSFPGELKFIEVGADEKPDMIVVYQTDVKNNGSSVAGLVNWRRKVSAGDNPSAQLSADVQLRTTQPNGGTMTLEHMRHTAAHELGHVLGLDDSPFYGDIMGPLDLKHPAKDFVETELEGLRAVRAEAFAMRRHAMAKI